MVNALSPRAAWYRTREQRIHSVQFERERQLKGVVQVVDNWVRAGLVEPGSAIEPFEEPIRSPRPDIEPPAYATLISPGRQDRMEATVFEAPVFDSRVCLGDWVFTRTDRVLRISRASSEPFPERVAAIQHSGPGALAEIETLIAQLRAEHRIDYRVSTSRHTTPSGELCLVIRGHKFDLSPSGLNATEPQPDHLGTTGWCVFRNHPYRQGRWRVAVCTEPEFRDEFVLLTDPAHDAGAPQSPLPSAATLLAASNGTATH